MGSVLFIIGIVPFKGVMLWATCMLVRAPQTLQLQNKSNYKNEIIDYFCKQN
jgi:hypothetical protein